MQRLHRLLLQLRGPRRHPPVAPPAPAPAAGRQRRGQAGGPAVGVGLPLLYRLRAR